MTDQSTLYRKTGPCIHGFNRPHRHHHPVIGADEACEGGRFVVAEPCEHGNYARHIDEDKEMGEGGSSFYFEYCDGQPEGNSE